MLIRQKSTCWVTHGGHDCTLVWWVRHPVCVKQAKMTFCLLFTSYSLLFRHYKAPHPSPLVTTVVLNFFVKYKNPDLLIPRWIPTKVYFCIVYRTKIHDKYRLLFSKHKRNWAPGSDSVCVFWYSQDIICRNSKFRKISFRKKHCLNIVLNGEPSN